MNFIKNSMLFLIAAFIFTSCVDDDQINEITDSQNELLLRIGSDLEKNDDLPLDARIQIMDQLEQGLEDDYNPFDVEIDESAGIPIEEFERELQNGYNAESSVRANCDYLLIGDAISHPCVRPGWSTPHSLTYFVFNPDLDVRRFEYMIARRDDASGTYIRLIDWTNVSINPFASWVLPGYLPDGNYLLCVRDLECGRYFIVDTGKSLNC